MKRKIGLILSIIMIFTMSITGVAAETEEKAYPSEIVAIREDISREEAMLDNGFDGAKSSSNIALMSSNDVYWKTWGEHVDKIMSDAVGAIPIGYSAHMQGDTVLSTYHYTRTYLGIFMNGDSGRVWGNYTVKATGTFCDDDVWLTSIHYVKYGTETN